MRRCAFFHLLLLSLSISSLLYLIPWTSLTVTGAGQRHRERSIGQQVCTTKTHIAFIKVPKAASTTFANIFQRFGLSRNLSFLLPKTASRVTFNHGYLPLLEGKSYFDIVSNHVVFNASFFAKVFPRDVVLVANLRFPLSRFVSSMQYLNHLDFLPKGLTIISKVQEFLSNCTKAIYHKYRAVFSNLQQAKWFRPNFDSIDYETEHATRQFIEYIDAYFDVVLIVEHIDESLVLMKRRLCWPMKDILYNTVLPPYSDQALKAKISSKDIISSLSLDQVSAHRKCFPLDYVLYEHCNMSLWDRIHRESADFFNEVQHFRHLNNKVKTFCQANHSHSLSVTGSMWNEDFVITQYDCNLMTLNTVKFRKLAIKKLYPKQSHG